MKATVILMMQDYDANAAKGIRSFEANWDMIRKPKFAYQVDVEGSVEDLAEQAFRIFNAPDEILNANERRIKGDYRGPSLSVGDVVQVSLVSDEGAVEVAHLLCASNGWQSKVLGFDM